MTTIDAAIPGRAIGEARIQNAFEAEELTSLRRTAVVRAIALTVIAIWIPIEGAWPESLFWVAFLPLFALNGVSFLVLHRLGFRGQWTRYVMPTIDAALMSFAFFVTNPFEVEGHPAALKLRFGNEIYYFVLIAASIASYSGRVVMYTGVACALGWVLGATWVMTEPGSFLDINAAGSGDVSMAERVAIILDPNAVVAGKLGKQVVLILIVTGILAWLAGRNRRLVFVQAAAERERGNLARYFSPNMVDDLAQSDEPLQTVRRQDVAVLFVDIVGFTGLSERETPEAVIALLRRFHADMEAAVFAHSGTLDKFLGDGIMATFGTPWPGQNDAGNAIQAAVAMVKAMAAWNDERQAAGDEVVWIGIGVHYGPVVLGDVGGENRLEFAVLGDSVNVASRLERLTRNLDTSIVLSDEVVAAARREDIAPELLRGFSRGDAQTLRGRAEPLDIWLSEAIF